MWTAAEKYPAPTVAHYRKMQAIQARALRAADRLWSTVDPRYISESWAEALPLLTLAVTDAQTDAAASATARGATALAATGAWRAPEAFLDPTAFAGAAPDGAPLPYMLYDPARLTKAGIGRGMSPAGALELGRNHLRTLVKTTVADAGRAAGGVDVAARRGVGFVRMLNPPSCGRCAVLAGRFYRWNAGFLRHPRCDCVHQMVAGREAAESEGLIADPYEYFGSLSPQEQDRYFGKGAAQAIRDGADLGQVVNAQRGAEYAGLSKDGTRRGQRRTGTTSEGTSRRGNYARAGGSGPRLTPEEIYRRAGENRARALQLLTENGYLLPGGQVPGGSIIGDREGMGALGRGGARRGASEAVRRARETGVRDPRQRATMTEAERRTFDATLRWQTVLEGRNPLGKGQLTPAVAARVEADYRRIVLDGGTGPLTSRKQARAAG